MVRAGCLSVLQDSGNRAMQKPLPNRHAESRSAPWVKSLKSPMHQPTGNRIQKSLALCGWHPLSAFHNGNKPLTKAKRSALYLRVSTDEPTTENLPGWRVSPNRASRWPSTWKTRLASR
jgi:hypothetical protein